MIYLVKYEVGNPVFEGTLQDCWKFLVATHGSSRVIDLYETGIRIEAK